MQIFYVKYLNRNKKKDYNDFRYQLNSLKKENVKFEKEKIEFFSFLIKLFKSLIECYL